jgi:hypothetical protein
MNGYEFGSLVQRPQTWCTEVIVETPIQFSVFLYIMFVEFNAMKTNVCP